MLDIFVCQVRNLSSKFHRRLHITFLFFCLQCQEYWPENENEMKEYEHMCITTLDQAKALDSRKRPLVDTVQRTFELVNKSKGTYFIFFY